MPDTLSQRSITHPCDSCIHAGPAHADGRPFDEEDWTDPDYKTVGPYVKSKVAACWYPCCSSLVGVLLLSVNFEKTQGRSYHYVLPLQLERTRGEAVS